MASNADTQRSGARQLLAGLRVAEVSLGPAGMAAGMVLASLGATVVRTIVPGEFARPGDIDVALVRYLNRGKQHLTLPRGRKKCRAALCALVAESDIVIEELDGAAIEALELPFDGYTQTDGGGPSAVVSVTPFGRTGPYGRFAATSLQTSSLYMNLARAGVLGQPPLPYQEYTAELYAGVLAATAALAGYRGAHSGGGKWPAYGDISVSECVLSSVERSFASSQFSSGASMRAEYEPEVFLPTVDGLLYVNPALDWSRTAQLIGRPDLLEKPEYKSLSQRTSRAPEIFGLLAEWAGNRSRAMAMADLIESRVLGAPLNDPHEAVADLHARARGAFEPIEANGPGGAVVAPAVPFLIDGVRPALSEARGVEKAEWPVRRLPPATYRERDGLGPLAGVRVLDLGELYAGPGACSLLGDLGADVIKVENIKRMPAVARGEPNPPPGAFGYFNQEPGTRPWERFSLFHTVERNKRGVTLDLKSERGHAIFINLVKRSHIVVSNYTPRALRSLGITPEALREANPDLAVVHMPGFGCTGPYADHVSVGPVVEALSGFWSLRGYPDQSPLNSTPSVWADAASAAMAAAIAVASTLSADSGVPGGTFDISQAEVIACFVAHHSVGHQLTGTHFARQADKHPRMAPHGYYRTAGDDEWVAVSVATDGHWQRLCDVVEGLDSAMFRLAPSRKGIESEIDAVLTAWTAPRERAGVVATLQGAGVPCMPVLGNADVARDPQVEHRNSLLQVEHDEVGPYWTVASPFVLTGVDRATLRPPNLLGEHNEEVLKSILGLSYGTLNLLRRSGVIGDRFNLD